MNILIVSSKSDAKVYKNIVDTVSDTNVLGTVLTVKADFITDLKNKWHPHIVIIDTAVHTKVNITEAIFNIKSYYPYIKVIVLTDENDSIDYPPSYMVVRGQITNLQFKDILNNINNCKENYLEVDADGKGTTEDLSKKAVDSAITEKLPDLQVDKLSTTLKIKIPDVKKKSKFRITNKGIIISVCVAISLIIILVVSCVILKSGTLVSSSTADEVITASSAVTTKTPSEEETVSSTVSNNTESHTIVESTDAYVATVGSITKNTTTFNEASSSSNNSTSDNDNSENLSRYNSSSFESSSSNSNANIDYNYDDSNYNSSSSSRTYSNSAVISYDNNQYKNSSTDKAQNVKLSYKSKTMYVGDILTMQFSVQPANADYSSVYWYSSNPYVASVDSNGKITALTTGSTTITVTVDSVSAQCTINVIKNPS